MSRIPLPERGQPLDLSYIYQIANAVNSIAGQLTPRVGRYTTIDTVNAGPQSIRTSDARIVAGYTTVRNTAANQAVGDVSFAYNFTDFKFAPVITATPILTGTASANAGKDVFVVLTRITTNRVEGVVKFKTRGVSEVGLNLVIVGIPV